MSKERLPSTQAIRTLRRYGIAFTSHAYRYEDKGGTRLAARELGVDEHLTVKTLVMEDERGRPFLVLMHGDREVSTKALARFLGVKFVRPCDPKAAHRHTGYFPGGISPFGTRKPLPVYVEASILALPRLYINAGRKGLLAEIAAADLKSVLDPIPVRVAVTP